jgi:hypothetical protein
MKRSTSLQGFNAQLQRAAMESELRARSSVTLAFRTLAMQSPREHYAQASMFAEPRCQDTRDERTCDHVGTGRDEQRTLTGETVAICAACGAEVAR